MSSSKGIPLIEIKNIHDKIVDKSCDSFLISNAYSPKFQKYFLKEGDVLIAMTGQASVGRIGKMRKLDKDYLVNQRVGIIRGHIGLVNSEFLYQILATDLHEKIYFNLAMGAGQPNLSPSNIGALELELPPLPTQKKIASILSAYDDLIENNLKRIRLLEEAAQHLYREWFVKFRFPGWEEVEVVDGLPVGWERKGFEEVSNNNNKRRIPLSSMEREKMKGKFPYYGATGIFDFVNQFLFEGRFLLIAEDGSVVDKNGFPVLQLVEGQFWVNNHAHIINGGILPTEFLYLAMKNQPIGHLVTGAVQPKLSMQNLRKVELIVPEKKILESFMGIALSLVNQVFILNLQNQKLKEARDILLPRLMNQTIEV
jgi:type I restriction enzyme, S subunit